MVVNGMELSWLCASARLYRNLQGQVPVGEKLKNLLASTLLATSGNNETENNSWNMCNAEMCLCLYAAGIIYFTVNLTIALLFQSPGRLRWSGPGQPLFSLPQRCCCFCTKNPCLQFAPFMNYCGATKTGSCQPFIFCILRSIQYLVSLIR